MPDEVTQDKLWSLRSQAYIDEELKKFTILNFIFNMVYDGVGWDYNLKATCETEYSSSAEGNRKEYTLTPTKDGKTSNVMHEIIPNMSGTVRIPVNGITTTWSIQVGAVMKGYFDRVGIKHEYINGGDIEKDDRTYNITNYITFTLTSVESPAGGGLTKPTRRKRAPAKVT